MEPFKCPACTLWNTNQTTDCVALFNLKIQGRYRLAISADGNRKHYWFKKSKGSVESFYIYIYIYIYIYRVVSVAILCSPAIDWLPVHAVPHLSPNA